MGRRLSIRVIELYVCTALRRITGVKMKRYHKLHVEQDDDTLCLPTPLPVCCTFLICASFVPQERETLEVKCGARDGPPPQPALRGQPLGLAAQAQDQAPGEDGSLSVCGNPLYWSRYLLRTLAQSN